MVARRCAVVRAHLPARLAPRVLSGARSTRASPYNPRMLFVVIEGRRYAQFERLADLPGLTHAFATRPLDVSPRRSPDAADRAARRGQMVRDFQLDPERLCYCLQAHTPRIATVDSDSPSGPYEGWDGLITAVPAAPLMTFSADCPLVLAYDVRRRVVGMVHSSWHCTVAGATRALIERMCADHGCQPGDIYAGIGPSAGPDAYEVQSDVYEAAAELPQRERFFRRRDGRMYFDLWEANRTQLIESGVPAAQIDVAGICTMTRNDLFFSYRREGAGCGHFGLLAAVV